MSYCNGSVGYTYIKKKMHKQIPGSSHWIPRRSHAQLQGLQNPPSIGGRGIGPIGGGGAVPGAVCASVRGGRCGGVAVVGSGGSHGGKDSKKNLQVSCFFKMLI